MEHHYAVALGADTGEGVEIEPRMGEGDAVEGVGLTLTNRVVVVHHGVTARVLCRSHDRQQQEQEQEQGMEGRFD